jgi:ubiquinol-cytochrome c reductase iron-sulfur subunit
MQSIRLRTTLTACVGNLVGKTTSSSAVSPIVSGTSTVLDVNPVSSRVGGFSLIRSNKNIVQPKKIFGNNTYRHVTPLVTRQTVRQYSTYVPPEIVKTVRNAPKTSYGGDNQTAYLIPQEDNAENRQQFAYLVNSGTRFIWSAGIRLLAFKFLHSISASAEVLALATIEVDISKIDPGKTITITWRGKPVFIKHRTVQEIEEIRSTPLSELKDPQPDEQRVKDENWSVLLAICTHLGCVPVTDAGAYNAFFCPCHGSHYDASGRIRRGPAPLNLEVPKHTFVEGGKVIVLG